MSCWGPNFSCHQCNYDTNTLGSPIISSSSKGLSTSLSTCELGPTTSNVSDGVCYLFSRNYVPTDLRASPNVDISVLLKTLALKIKHVFIYFLFKNIQHFFSLETKGFNKV
jgi:hypothetical protein